MHCAQWRGSFVTLGDRLQSWRALGARVCDLNFAEALKVQQCLKEVPDNSEATAALVA
jgi:hypothetical protein